MPIREDSKNEPKKHGNGLKIVAGVLLVVVLAGAYLYYTYGSLPSAVLSSKQVNESTLRSALLQKISSTPQLSFAYLGSIVINNTDPYIAINFSKYYNDSRATFSFTQFPVLGNVSVIIISLNNGTSGYGCLKAWNSTLGEAKGYVCTTATGLATSGIMDTLNRIVNTSSISNLQISSYGISLWNGQPCYSVSGSGAMKVNGALVNQAGFIPSTFDFDSCFSAQYNIPLTLNGTFDLGNGRFAHVRIRQTGMGLATSDSEVVSLPGPVLNG
ncbi:Uncharacterised protein [uncultured archaeon]|nr:Uncharacterised protein [uncultured archaeon]